MTLAHTTLFRTILGLNDDQRTQLTLYNIILKIFTDCVVVAGSRVFFVGVRQCRVRQDNSSNRLETKYVLQF